MSKNPSDHSNDPPRKKQAPNSPKKIPVRPGMRPQRPVVKPTSPSAGPGPQPGTPTLPWRPGNPADPVPFPPRPVPGPFNMQTQEEVQQQEQKRQKFLQKQRKANYPDTNAPKANPLGPGQDSFLPKEQRKPKEKGGK